MSALVADIETDGLSPSTIWTVCANGEEYREPSGFAAAVARAEEVWFHNGIAFDAPVLEGLWDVKIDPKKLRDSMVCARLVDPSRTLWPRKSNKLEDWGEFLGHAKPEHEDWSRYSSEMRHRCMEDVAITTKVVELVKGELEQFSERSVELEHEVQYIIAQQIKNGWLLDQEKAFDLLGILMEERIWQERQCHETFVPIAVPVKEIQPKYKKDGSLSVVGLKFLGDDWVNVGGPLTRIEWQEFNLGSTKQIGERLQRAGWKPYKFTETGQPQVSDDVLENVDIPEAKLIARYLMLQKRIGQIQGWLDAVEDDGRVHGYVNSNGAVTGRMTHSNPNMANVTSGSKEFGHEMRACWTVPKGKRLVGCDASGLELRMLAHYMNDPEYAREVVEGDVHWANTLALGLVPKGTARDKDNPEHEKARGVAKTFIYAFLYGAGDAKVGSIVSGSKREGAALKAKFLAAIPSLDRLIDRVKQASRRGWLKGLDGRRVYVRSQHAALNTLLQSAGAIVMKEALCYTNRYAKLNNLDFLFVGNIHDEFQAEVAEKDAQTFGWIAEGSITAAGESLGLRVPLAGEYKIGSNWAETH